jgi:hypothetical protein
LLSGSFLGSEVKYAKGRKRSLIVSVITYAGIRLNKYLGHCKSLVRHDRLEIIPPVRHSLPVDKIERNGRALPLDQHQNNAEQHIGLPCHSDSTILDSTRNLENGRK